MRTRFLSGDFMIKAGEAPREKVLMAIAELFMYASMAIRHSAKDNDIQIPDKFSVDIIKERWDVQIELVIHPVKPEGETEQTKMLEARIVKLEKELADATLWGQACDDVRASLEAQLEDALNSDKALNAYSLGRADAETEYEPVPDGEYKDKGSATLSVTRMKNGCVHIVSEWWGEPESVLLKDGWEVFRRKGNKDE